MPGSDAGLPGTENRNRMLMSVLVLALAAAALFCLRFISFENDIKVMLPNQPEIMRTFDFFRESPLSGNIYVSFETGEAGDTDQLIDAVDQYAASLDSPLIHRVLTGIGGAVSAESIGQFIRLAPQIMGEQELDALDKSLDEEFVQKKLKGVYERLLSPSGFASGEFAALDPLNLQKKALMHLKELAPAIGRSIEIRNGHMISRDGRHALMIIETGVSVTEGNAGKELTGYLKERFKTLPPAVSAELVSGHLHSISNEKVIKRDVLVTACVASAGFLALFIFFFKDLRGVLLFMVPLVSVLFSIPLCAWILGGLSSIILGMGAVISGIAVDYCIHVYVALRNGLPKKSALGEVTRPIMIGALTTAGVFSVFLFSQVRGYRELALFTVMSILISLALSIFVLPHFLEKSRAVTEKTQTRRLSFWGGFSDKMIVVLWGVILAVLLAAVPFVHFRTDVKQYDGSEPQVIQNEERFKSMWGYEDPPAMLVTGAPSFEEALEKNYALQSEVEKAIGREGYKSLSSIWPPELVRLENLVRWNRYWKGERSARLKTLFSAYSPQYDFSPDAFKPFWDMLYLGPEAVKGFEEMDLLKQVKERFSFETKNEYRIMNFFDDRAALVEKIRNVIRDKSGVFIVSSERFAELLSKALFKESVFLSVIIAFMIPGITFAFLRNVNRTLIALIPVVTSIAAILGGFSLLRSDLNAASIIALLVVGGLSIDYGVFMVYQCHHRIKTDTHLAVALSALTTLLGAGALVTAKHPVLFSYGITMVLGIAAGYLAAALVVPALYRLKNNIRTAECSAAAL